VIHELDERGVELLEFGSVQADLGAAQSIPAPPHHDPAALQPGQVGRSVLLGAQLVVAHGPLQVPDRPRRGQLDQPGVNCRVGAVQAFVHSPP